MEQQENRNGTNVIGDIKDGINLFGASTGNPIKYTWNIFGMAIVAVGSIILLKGNHDYWWTTLKKLREFIEKNSLDSIEFLYNNSYLVENKLIVGTRGWNILDIEDDGKMLKRENARLELSIQDGIKKYGKEKEMIAFMHYPPINKNDIIRKEESIFVKTLKKYNIHKCYYGHLHGISHKEAVEGNIDGIEYRLISADYINFDLIKV